MVSGFGNRLKYVRLSRGLTLQALANITGISKTQLYFYEHGEQDVRGGNLVKLCVALNVSADFLLFGRG
jgi:transcriptional regulator with XRE-family HTH domain